jgi:hypothetical protein
MLLDTKLSDVPVDLVETRNGITDLKTALTKAASATPEITTSEHIAIQTQIEEARLRLRNAIESELSWIVTSPMSSQLLRRQTPLVEPRTIAQFTTGELNLNADLLLQLQQGAITGAARSVFEYSMHGSFIQAWTDIRADYSNTNARQKFSTVSALFDLARKNSDLAKFKVEVLKVCTAVSLAGLTMADLMKYAILNALDKDAQALRVILAERMVTQPEESVIEFVQCTFNTMDLSDGISSGTRIDASVAVDKTKSDKKCNICGKKNHLAKECRSGSKTREEWLANKPTREAARTSTTSSSPSSPSAYNLLKDMTKEELAAVQKKLCLNTVTTVDMFFQGDAAMLEAPRLHIDTSCDGCYGEIFRELTTSQPHECVFLVGAVTSDDDVVGTLALREVTRTIVFDGVPITLTGRAIGERPAAVIGNDILVGLHHLDELGIEVDI